ncbi:nucleotidyltransferase domain-containing protein [Thermococcus sp. SY098]|uniref:nucleotidyltransferase domain-containing protein n=1 Tax=Thermococcus sp. SY098 TaxID=3111325 RepID=UPI002D76AD84|nr:nucleotidyltransferase domain-containing protein [Thermococcus sp. SY098]WRS53232.1 nucleotidyltransferase domain-containing protein [Thermococcus sp. SY098]
MSKEKALKEFVQILKERYGKRIKEIILFGSFARGDYDEESDIDVLIVAKNISQKEISEITWEILMKYGEVISAIVEEESEFEKYRDYSFHRIILKEGIRIG